MPAATPRSARIASRFLAGCLALAIGLFLVVPAAGAADFGIVPGSFSNAANDPLGNELTQAGDHPDLTTSFMLNTTTDKHGAEIPAEDLKDARVELPAGFVGNPSAALTCARDQFNSKGGTQCPVDSQVGVALLDTRDVPGNLLVHRLVPLFNLVPQTGHPAELGFRVERNNVVLRADVRSGSDYGITITVADNPGGLILYGSHVTVWGVPASPAHDALRFAVGQGAIPGDPNTGFGPLAATAPPRAFISNPTRCGVPPTTRIELDSWQNPGAWTHDEYSGSPITGCNQLDFSPTIEARPTTNVADSPSGLDVDLHVPQNDDASGLTEAHLRDASVLFPAGMTVNPSSAQGLDACSPAQVGLSSAVGQTPPQFDVAQVTCPDASKLGTVQIDTPVLPDPLKGTIYLATQNQNPFNSLLALYIVVEDPKTGITVKLAGHPVPDPQSGRLRVSFDQNPQLPFEDLHVNLFTGPRASLKTPLSCGTYTTTSNLVPWSSPEGASATPSDSFAISAGAGNSACPKSDSEAPNKPAFSAGTLDPSAGAYSPFVLKLTRADGTQPLAAIDATLPKGLLGKLAGIPYCSDGALAAAAGKSGKAEQASASCPAASQVGSVTVGAGAGSLPLYVSGKAYLAGPYKGAPLSLAIITPALAGPFDLGTVVVRTALDVDPETAQIHAVSDPLPTILQGIPLDLRSIALSMDRPSFTLNPTSCDPSAITGGATSVFNQTAALSSPFQVGGCGALGFKPQLAIDLKGGTKRSEYPALRATLKARSGDANIGKAVVSLPHSEFLAQSHIKTICTRVQFAANVCPPGSVYGKARAFSPLLDQPLEGPVYLRSSSNKLPDLVADLGGQIRVVLVGRIDSVKGGIRTSFESVPDAPVSKFVLEMAGGKKGLLENSRNLCKTTNKASAQLDGQNGKTSDSTPLVTNDCKAPKHRAKHKKSAHKRPVHR